MADKFAGRVVAVTGAAQGIGREIARQLVASGARVAIGDKNIAAAEATAAELSTGAGSGSAGGGRVSEGSAHAFPLDVTDTASFQAFLDSASSELGPLDVLVNNAGVMWVGAFDEEPESATERMLAVNLHGVIRGVRLAAPAMRAYGQIDVLHNNVGIVPAGRTEELAPETWRQGFEVNLTGMWQTCKHVLPHMRERGTGAVINISSMAGLLHTGDNIAYTTSKAAVHSLTRSLAIEYAPHGVRINCIAPGMMDTPMGVDAVARATGTDRETVATRRAALVPMGHQGTSDDVAKAALFYATDDSAFITGTVLPVDGGFTLRAGMP